MLYTWTDYVLPAGLLKYLNIVISMNYWYCVKIMHMMILCKSAKNLCFSPLWLSNYLVLRLITIKLVIVCSRQNRREQILNSVYFFVIDQTSHRTSGILLVLVWKGLNNIQPRREYLLDEMWFCHLTDVSQSSGHSWFNYHTLDPPDL